MKKIIFLLLVKLLTFLALNSGAANANEIAKLRYDERFIFEKVLELKKLNNRPNVSFPKIFFESKTPLKQFQDALEKQWGMRPESFTNAFSVANNEIYIMDDAEYYRRNERCMDDSLAHELVHYLQVKYQNWDLNDESLEWEAVEIQTAFRSQFCQMN